MKGPGRDGMAMGMMKQSGAVMHPARRGPLAMAALAVLLIAAARPGPTGRPVALGSEDRGGRVDARAPRGAAGPPSEVQRIEQAASGAQPPASSASEVVPPGDAARGAAIFVKDGCYQCHGRVGQGGAAGPRLGPPPIGFRAFVRALRRPNQMPPYSERVLSEAEVADLYAFVRALPRPSAVDELAILR